MDIALSSVVLPVPVPPETMMLSSPSRHALRNVIDSSVSEPMRTRSGSVSRCRLNLRIVSSAPVNDSGGMIALTRLPSGRRASTIGDPSSTRRPIWADDAVDDPPQVRLVREADVALVQLAVTLDPDVARPVDHDLRHGVVGQQPLERPVAERVVEDLVDQPLAVGQRQVLLLREPCADLRTHDLAQLRRDPPCRHRRAAVPARR